MGVEREGCGRRGSLEGAQGRPLAKVGDATGDPERLELMQLITILCLPQTPPPPRVVPCAGTGCGFPYSPAARPMSTWASSWRRSSPTKTQPPTMNWPGSTVITPILALVRQSAKVHVGDLGTGQEDQNPGSWVVRVPLSVFPVPLDRLQTCFQLLEGQEICGGH